MQLTLFLKDTFVETYSMKKMIVLLVSTLFIINITYCQTALRFCGAISPENGYCIFNNTKFISSPDSASERIYMQIKNPRGLSSDKVTFKIFSVGKGGEETFSHSLVQNIQKEWDSSWQPEIFDSPGTYLIKVYNDADLLICSKSFELLKYW